MKSDIKSQVQHIVETLESTEADYCHDCECTVEPVENDGELCCPDCGADSIGQMSGFDYLTDALDIEYVIGSDRQFLGARVLVAFGGPNIWIDTRHNRVDGHWWSESYNEAFTDNIGLADALEELWECQ